MFCRRNQRFGGREHQFRRDFASTRPRPGNEKRYYRPRRVRLRATGTVGVSRCSDECAEVHGQYIFDSCERHLQLQVYIGDTGFRITAIHVRLSASMLRILILLLFPRLFAATVSPAVTSYAKISRNGQLARSSHDSFPWISSIQTRNDTRMDNEEKSTSDIVITVSPIYVTPRTSKLKKGEVVDHSTAPRYSTLDHEMIAARLNAGRKQIQQRFTPHAAFDHADMSTNGRPQKGTLNSGDFNTSSFPGPISLAMYEYGPPEFVEDKPTSKPMISVPKYPPVPTDDKMPNGYQAPSSNYHAGDGPEMEYSNFDIASSYENNEPMKKPMKFANHHERPFSYMEDSYGHGHDFHHEVIYDHLPEYHEHHVEHTTQEPPEMNDQRLDKRPYSYYFIGKKLWYVPLYFSIYFIIYIAALVLKSIARHKINFPTTLAEAATHSKRSEPDDGWWNFAGRILEGVERFAEMSGSKDFQVNAR